jgi:predicted kinase
MIKMKSTKKLLFERMSYLNEDFTSPKPKFTIPVGISGSGKSTWINQNTNPDTVIISPDEIRRELSGDVSNQGNMGLVFEIAFKRTVNALNGGSDVIFDATNVRSDQRKDMLDYLKKNVRGEFDAYAKVFDVDPEITKGRIKTDIEKGVDRSNVPDHAVDKQHKNFMTDIGNLESDGYKIIN